MSGGSVITGDAIPLFAMRVLASACRLRAVTGRSITRTLPTVKVIRERYDLTCKTYAEAAEQLTAKADDIEAMRQIRR